MSVRMLALELYEALKEVESLEKKLESLSPAAPERDDLDGQLRRARADRDRIRSTLEGAKEK